MEDQDDGNLLDTRQRVINDYLKTIRNLLQQVLESHPGETKIKQIQTIIGKVQLHLTDLIGSTRSSTDIAYVGISDLTRPWKIIGEGNFGQVFDSRLSGSRVAIKVFKERAKSQFRESNLLRYLSHGNIIAYRGMGYVSSKELTNITRGDGKSENDTGNTEESSDKATLDDNENLNMFIVMEFIDQNLYNYVQSIKSYERSGLSASQTWSIGQQIASALGYLHSHNIVHRDLKPDNILLEVGPNRILVKVADFGLAWHNNQINKPFAKSVVSTSQDLSSFNVSLSSSAFVNLRWGPPEFCESTEGSDFDSLPSESSDTPKFTLKDFKHGDVYCFGLVLAYTLTGQKPYADLGSSALEWLTKRPQTNNLKNFTRAHGPLLELLTKCLQDLPADRPEADKILGEFFAGGNPYIMVSKDAEFFSLGFLQNTKTFVLDSCVSDHIEQGYFQTGVRPIGYDHSDLVCEIDSRDAPYRDRPPHWTMEEEEKYIELYQDNLRRAGRGEIDNNPKAALKSIVLLREGENEKQSVRLKFKETEYCHQQAMRFFWRTLTDDEKLSEVPCKLDVNPYFSNTLGVNISIITNEGAANTPKFMFLKRAERAGVPTPGAYTGGVAEGTSRMDYTRNGSCINLVHTAARGLKEELGLDLTGCEIDAICLTTLFLSYDNYEWGICGVVDLNDERIRTCNRLSAQMMRDRFVTGPKDKFEHEKVKFVLFNLEPMVQFVFENHNNIASYSKLAIVKVLQAYFGWNNVQREFEGKLPY